jgi:phospholipase C
MKYFRGSPNYVSFLSILAMTSNTVAPASIAATLQPNDDNTTTPIRHVIVIYGENRSFDHQYATYQPKQGETVNNLLSEGIVNQDGSPGPNFSKAAQATASDTDTFAIAPTKTGPYAVLPPLTAGGPTANSDTSPPFNDRPALRRAGHAARGCRQVAQRPVPADPGHRL